MTDKKFLKEKNNVIKKLHNKLKLIALSSLKSSVNTYKTVDLDGLIGFGFNSNELLIVAHEEIKTIESKIPTHIKWMTGNLQCKIKFYDPYSYLEYIGYKTNETKLYELKQSLSFCKTDIAKNFVNNLSINDLSRLDNIIITARFINHVSDSNYKSRDIRTLSATIYTGRTSEKDASKVLDKKLRTIKNILISVIPERKKEIIEYCDSVYKFKNPLYLYGNILIETDNMILKGIQKPYLPLLPINIDVTKPICNYLITIENKTSFHVFVEVLERLGITNIIVVYTNGNSNHDVISFLKHTCKKNNLNIIHHFGDIDCGGILIRRHISNQTGCHTIPIIWTEELIKKYGTKLKYDDNIADNNIEQYAIKNNLRVEQENIDKNILYKIIENYFEK